MSTHKVIHRRLVMMDGQWFYDSEPITDTEAAHLIVHYKRTVDALKEPWNNRDRWYDELGRLNYGWER